MSEIDDIDDVQASDEMDEASVESPPAAIATKPATFYDCGGGVDALDDPTPFGHENALQKLGKPPFEKSVRSKFRLLGYLATVYEHVSDDVKRERQESE